MKLVCAWCQARLGDNGDPYTQDIISHGICSWCVKDVKTEIAKRLDEPLPENETTH